MYHTEWGSIPKGHYPIIYADPPWLYNDKMKGHSFSLDHEYETQPKTWIQELPVRDIAAKDAVLFMWVTNPQLPVGLETMSRWGFRYKTVAFCWRKLTSRGREAVNLGRWTMGGMELCLLGVRGHPTRIARNVRQLVTAARREHSRKPDEVRERIVTLMGDVPRIELFARGESEGWDQWGNQVANIGTQETPTRGGGFA